MACVWGVRRELPPPPLLLAPPMPLEALVPLSPSSPAHPPPPPSLTDVEEETGYYVREFPNPQFIEEVREAFPDKMVASPDEARVSGG